MAVLALLLPILAPMVASLGSRDGRLGSTVSPPRPSRGRRRGPRIAAIVCVGSRSAGLGVVSQLVDQVDRVVVVHDRSKGARWRLADLSGDPRIDLVSARSGRRARSRAQLAGLEHTLEHHAADAILVMGGDIVQLGDVVAVLLDALPGHDAVVAERNAAPAPLRHRVGPWLRTALRALVGRERPDSGCAAFLLTAEALNRVSLERGPGRAELRHPETMLAQGLDVARVRLPEPR